MKTSKTRFLAIIPVLFVLFSFTARPGNTTVSDDVTIGSTGGTSTVSFVYPSGGLYETPTAVIDADHFSVPLTIYSHNYDSGLGKYEDVWKGDATDPSTGIEYPVSFMIIGNDGSWTFQSTPTVNGIE
jgi:hypothetical protein